ncbi:MAG: oxidoreductase [Burkholderiales bacterium]|jgi:UDP-N-acetyl-2-amino-2-deoxyglucuronate dehydrogenase|nr:oxidoreductase [Burkholderiales bacterium]
MLKKSKIITGRKIKFALVGCGRIANNHIAALKEHSESCELAALCDINVGALDEMVSKTGATGYNSLTAMLEAGGFDAVILTTPSGLHPLQTIECAEYGFHVITEKPMATKFSDGLEMVKACDRAGVKLFVVKQNRRNATIQLLKQAIDSNRFGRIYSVACNVFWTRPQEYYDAAKWRGTWEFDGGAFMNQASHYVDLLDWLIGPVESVQSYIATLARRIDVEDSGVVALKWRNGALGTMNVSMLTYPKNLEGSITIIGEKGTARIGGVAVNEIQVWDFQEKHENDETIKAASYATTSVYGFGHPKYYENVIKTLRGEEDAHTDGREGLKSLELLIAIYLSARDSKKVSLPLEY